MDLGAETRATRLLAGPRGRALCAAVAGLDNFHLLRSLDRPISGAVVEAVEAQNAGRPGWPPLGWDALRSQARDTQARPAPAPSEVLARAVASIDIDVLAGARDELTLLPSLVEAVSDVMFSGDEESVRELLGTAAEALVPVAEALTGAPGAAWWWSPCDQSAQRWIRFSSGPSRPPLVGAREALADWARSEADVEGRSASLVPFPPRAGTPRYTGTWWSTPPYRRLLRTTRSLPGLPAAGLALIEDSPPDKAVEVWDVRPAPRTRIFEVDGPVAWCELTERFPKEVTLSRRHDWWRWTGWEGRWFIPDWVQVADAFDAVHLSVAGQLEASYRALAVPGGATCLAGFDPDETIWLTDIVAGGHPFDNWEGGTGRNLLHDRTRPWLGGPRPGES